MESVLLKANLVNLSTGQYWLNFDGQKGMSDREGHGHKAVLYKSHFPPLRHSFSQRHHCIHRLINHVYYQRTKLFVIHCPTTQTLLGCCQLVLAFSHFTGWYSTVPPKSVLSVISFKPFNCPQQAFLISGLLHLPKEKYFTFRTTTPSKSEIFSHS